MVSARNSPRAPIWRRNAAVRAWSSRAIVHVDRAVDLDLDRLPRAARIAVAARDEAARIGVVPVDRQAAMLEEIGERRGRFPVKRGTITVAADDVGKPVVQAVEGRHRMHVDKKRAPVPARGSLEKARQRYHGRDGARTRCGRRSRLPAGGRHRSASAPTSASGISP